jgi:hypothetical protein
VDVGEQDQLADNRAAGEAWSIAPDPITTSTSVVMGERSFLGEFDVFVAEGCGRNEPGAEMPESDPFQSARISLTPSPCPWATWAELRYMHPKPNTETSSSAGPNVRFWIRPTPPSTIASNHTVRTTQLTARPDQRATDAVSAARA